MGLVKKCTDGLTYFERTTRMVYISAFLFYQCILSGRNSALLCSTDNKMEIEIGNLNMVDFDIF